MKELLKSAKRFFNDFWLILKTAGISFSDNNSLKLSASLSYYTIFSLAPVLIIIIAVSGIFYGQEAIQGKLYNQIDGLIGKDAAKQVQELIKNASQSKQSVFATIIGLVTLFVGATGVFLEIQSSINYIWNLRTKPKKGIIKFLVSQLISFSMVISLGFLLLVSLGLNSILDIFFTPLQDIIEGFTIHIIYILNILVTFLIITILFGAIFKILPDANLKIRDAAVGASFTSFLFMIGKFLIGFYLSQTNTMSVFGSASALVLILLWVYYCSIILYFGAEFTKAYTTKFGNGIIPKSFAVIDD